MFSFYLYVSCFVLLLVEIALEYSFFCLTLKKIKNMDDIEDRFFFQLFSLRDQLERETDKEKIEELENQISYYEEVAENVF